jgi:hypothetical protein
MFAFPLRKFLEFSALLPFLAICLASFSKYTFYKSLDMLWIFNQLDITSILLSSTKLFLWFFLAFCAAVITTFIFDLLPQVTFFEWLFRLLVVTFGMFLGLYLSGIITSKLTEVSIYLLYIFVFINFNIFLKLDSVSRIGKILFYSIFLVSLINIPFLISLQSQKNVNLLLTQHKSFSQVFFTKEALNTIPVIYKYKDSNGKAFERVIDWRILEMIGDKVIVIASNTKDIDKNSKPQVRIVEYKLIDQIR